MVQKSWEISGHRLANSTCQTYAYTGDVKEKLSPPNSKPFEPFSHFQIWKQGQAWRERICIFSLCLNAMEWIWGENSFILLNPPFKANFMKAQPENNVSDQRVLHSHFDAVTKTRTLLDRANNRIQENKTKLTPWSNRYARHLAQSHTDRYWQGQGSRAAQCLGLKLTCSIQCFSRRKTGEIRPTSVVLSHVGDGGALRLK
jgi:hypothetical protein